MLHVSFSFLLFRHDILAVPTQDDAALCDWLNVKWREKEERLRHFYNDSREFSDVSVETASGDVGQESAEDRLRVETRVSLENVRLHNDQVARFAMFAALLGWAAFLVITISLTCCYAWARYFTVVVVVFYVIVSHRFGGLDNLTLQLHERQKRLHASDRPKDD